MIRVTIDSDAKVDNDISSSWITEQVNRKRAAAGFVCASVQIDQENVHLTLATPGCTGVTSTSRPPNSQERQLINNWARLHLDTSEFAASELAAFVQPFLH